MDAIQQKTDNNSAQAKVQNLPPIDIFLNPKKEQHKSNIIKKMKNTAKDFFKWKEFEAEMLGVQTFLS